MTYQVLATKWLVVFIYFMVPISTYMTSILTMLLLVLWLFNINNKEFLSGFNHPVSWTIYLYLFVHIVSMIYSNAHFADVLHSLWKNLRLLLVPILIPIFYKQRWQERAIMAFTLSLLLSLLVVLAKLTGLVRIDLFYLHSTEAFKDRIFTSLFFAFGIFLHLNIFIEIPRYRHFSAIALLIFTIYLLFVTEGRSGQILLFLLIGLFFIQRERSSLFCSVYKFCVVSLLLFIVAVSICSKSTFNQRINAVFDDCRQILISNQHINFVGQGIKQVVIDNNNNNNNDNECKDISHIQTKFVPAESSTGVRLELLKFSWEIVKRKPLLGSGAGSFTTVYNDYVYNKYGYVDDKTNPHNQYMLTLIEKGFIGLFSLIIIYLCIFYMSIRNSSMQAKLCIGFLLTVVVGNIGNSWMSDFTSMHYFILFTAILIPKPHRNLLGINSGSE